VVVGSTKIGLGLEQFSVKLKKKHTCCADWLSSVLFTVSSVIALPVESANMGMATTKTMSFSAQYNNVIKFSSF